MMQSTEQTSSVLAFESVSLADAVEYRVRLEDFSLTLERGACARIVASGEAHVPTADLALGLIDPDAGAVRCEGQDWRGLPSHIAAERRLRIGRVFQHRGFLSNLDMDENVWLSERMRGRNLHAVREEADALARRFGLDGLPGDRPAHAGRDKLMRAQWVRALLGEPFLLVLEYPERDVETRHLKALVTEVEKAIERGAAALWITTPAASSASDVLHPVWEGEVKDGILRGT